MNIKTLFIIGLLTYLKIVGYSQELQITFKLTDESGKPVSNATVGIATFERWDIKPGEGEGEDIWKNTKAKTDTNGMATIEGNSPRADVAYGIDRLPGYYWTKGGDFWFKSAVSGKWQPWNPTLELVLRPILNPVPMYAKRTENLTLPEVGKSIGYDLIIGDWVMPYGKGLKSDLIFRLERKPDRTVKTADYYKRDVKLFDATLTVAFSNPDDGIQPIPTNNEYIGCEFDIPRFAPEDGYMTNLTERTYRESADQQIVLPAKEKLGYFYRIRTVEQDGKLASALYGSMSSISFGVINSPTAIVNFTYYLNPEPNSRNMEFDPGRNLFKKLPSLEQVSAP
jgi:hypothetical protein